MIFTRLASIAARAAGSSAAFAAAVLVIVAWGLSGPVFGFSDTWQLIINTGTTIVTFLLVVLLQNSQNREMAALHAKLDTIVAAIPDADDALTRAEDRPIGEIEALRPDKETP